MTEGKVKILSLLLVTILVVCGSVLAEDQAMSEQSKAASRSAGSGDSFFNNTLFSARVEGIFRRNFRTNIRENSGDNNKAYFNSIYLNAEGRLSDSIDFLIEFQPYVSDLYLLGGFVSIAEPLEGIASDPEEIDEDSDPRKLEIAALAISSIELLDDASHHPSAERVQLDYFLNEHFGLKFGRVRNPWGFWDDYSLFRNLSAGKTDPITLGLQLRRTDYGAISYGKIDSNFSYEFGFLTGENTIDEIESNSAKDGVIKLAYSQPSFDLGLNYYHHDIGESHGPIHAAGAHWRIGLTYDLTLLGEYIYAHNNLIDVSTKSFYIQTNYNLSDLLFDGLRWNTFFESYNSDLLKVDLDDDVDYRYAGTILRGSTGLLYSIRRDTDIGAQIIVGKDEEGDNTLEMAFKFDLRL